MKNSRANGNINASLILIALFSFFVGIAGGLYWSQKKTQGIPTSFVPIPPVRQALSEAEPNDSPDAANTITPGTPTQGTLKTAQDIDFFKVSVGAPSRIQIALSQLPLEYQFYIYGPDKQLLAVSQRRGFLDATSTFLAPQKGTYYMKIFSNYGATTANPYTMLVTVLPPTQ